MLDQPRYAIDTEFHRERTYFPKLALVQIAWPGELVLIHRDLKPEDLGFILSPTEDYPFGNVLGAPSDDPEVEDFWASFTEATGANPTLERFVEALEAIEAGRVNGKIVLSLDASP